VGYWLIDWLIDFILFCCLHVQSNLPVRPLLVSDHAFFFQSNLYSWNLSQATTSRKRPLFGLTFWIFLLFVTSGTRPFISPGLNWAE